MCRKTFYLFLIFLFVQIQIFAHSGKPKYHVVIDTDGAIDDMRAISMLLAGNDIRTLAITCSQGTLIPDSVYHKVKGLLSAFYHQGIPVGIGEKTDLNLPPWTNFAASVIWGPSGNEDMLDTGLS